MKTTLRIERTTVQILLIEVDADSEDIAIDMVEKAYEKGRFDSVLSNCHPNTEYSVEVDEYAQPGEYIESDEARRFLL